VIPVLRLGGQTDLAGLSEEPGASSP
jgi:hypothetical protein